MALTKMQVLVQQNSKIVPVDPSLEARVATDCWAYERLLSTLAKKRGTGGVGETLRSIANGVMEAFPEFGISLSSALAQVKSITM